MRIPRHARQELLAYLDCGLLCRGFARLKCPQWSADGRELLWATSGQLNAVRVKTAPGFSVGHPVTIPFPLALPGPSLPRSYDVTPAGKFIGLIAPESVRTAAPIPPVFQVVLNWFEELRAKVPTRP